MSSFHVNKPRKGGMYALAGLPMATRSLSRGSQVRCHPPVSAAWSAAMMPLVKTDMPMDQAEDSAQGDISRRFAAIPERNTGDALLRTTQQHHVQLSMMADTKANILITVSSIVLTMILGKLNDPDLRAAMLTLAGFVLLALLLAVVAVLPKYRPLRVGTGPLPGGFNLLFFGHFSELPRERFLGEMASTLKADGSVYEAMARDVYSMGYYLAHHKYRYLRLSYLFFLGGFLCACMVEAIHVLAN